MSRFLLPLIALFAWAGVLPVQAQFDPPGTAPAVPAFDPSGGTADLSEGAVRDKNVVARLVADRSAIAPGETFTLGLEFQIDPTWHTYWINPGETGKPTVLKLDLPEGFESSPLQFPVPKRFITDYGFGIREAGFGYEDSVIHTLTVTAPDSIQPGESITISGEADWLMCDPESCVPGKASLSLTLDVAETSAPSPDATAIEKSAKKVPAVVDWPIEATLEGENVVVTVDLPEELTAGDLKWEFFPMKVKVFDQLADSEVTLTDRTLRIATQKDERLEALPDPFAGVLIGKTGEQKTGYFLSTGDASPDSAADSAPTTTVTDSGTGSTSDAEPAALPFGGGLLGILFAAFLGGIILNVMPCVFPVISLKVMSFVGQAGEDRKKVFAHSAVFALGVLVFFWILTIAMLILRSAGGGEVGWGAQLQQPAFVVALIFVMVAVALSLFGTIEFGTSMTGVGGNLTTQSGYLGSFWSGALAVLLATPCTAPLMAPAIGFALSQSAPIMFAVFTALGLGLAAPYFVFAVFPKLLDVIPAPGPWMETFKQFMGFPMLAVAVWLIGVLSKQLSVEGLQWALASVLFLALSVWILGRFGGFDRVPSARIKARVLAAAVFLLSLGVAWSASGNRAPASQVDLREVIAGHQDDGKAVFVDFTAEWCVTCKVNERTTIKTDEVQMLFADNDIEFVIADWTNEDPRITEVLKEFGRAGVPFYVLYPSDPDAAPITLGDGLITRGDIEEAIAEL